ncbi:conserved hypothetical protein [Ricinus communis]|uniref:Protein kinase domain-containing protein n=1 Tax=Ricinus communis TaxID=3988 RepID=B9SQ43_RICCO|nr:conserved hypothetical protein [Ricinus communis]
MTFSCFNLLNSCKRKNRHSQQQTEEIVTNNVRVFSYNSLRSATKDFHPSNRIGGGGFGVVYRGVLRDGTQVAIKSLSAESKQGKHEFMTEISLISNIRHPNLVELIGCCVEDSKRVLVQKVNILPWTGLTELPFVLALLLVLHFYTRKGYLAPEYALLGQLTKKADVYSFGVLILEIISGRSSNKAAFGEDLLVLVEWTWKLKKEERLLDLVDPELTEYPEDEVMRFIKIALFCTQAAAQQRPTMKQVVEMLSRNVNLNEKALTEPGVYRTRTTQHLGSCSSDEISSSHKKRGKQSVDLLESSNQLDCSHSVAQMLPR